MLSASVVFAPVGTRAHRAYTSHDESHGSRQL